MSSEARAYFWVLTVAALWLVCAAGVVSCATEKQKSRERRIRFELMMNDTNQMEAISEHSVKLRKDLR